MGAWNTNYQKLNGSELKKNNLWNSLSDISIESSSSERQFFCDRASSLNQYNHHSKMLTSTSCLQEQWCPQSVNIGIYLFLKIIILIKTIHCSCEIWPKRFFATRWPLQLERSFCIRCKSQPILFSRKIKSCKTSRTKLRMVKRDNCNWRKVSKMLKQQEKIQ